MEVDKRNNPFAPGLPPGQILTLLAAQAPHAVEAMFRTNLRIVYTNTTLIYSTLYTDTNNIIYTDINDLYTDMNNIMTLLAAQAPHAVEAMRESVRDIY